MWGSSDSYYDDDGRDSDEFLDDILAPLSSEGIEDIIVGEDCFLSPDCLKECLTPPPSQEKWKAFLSDTNPAVITIDSAKNVQWRLAQKEIEHVRANFMAELEIQNFREVTLDAIIMYCIGPESATGIFVSDSLNLSKKTYLQFLGTLFFQAAYKVSTTQLLNSRSK